MTPAQRAALQRPDLGPATLIYTEIPHRIDLTAPSIVETYLNNEEALQRASVLSVMGRFHDPFILLGLPSDLGDINFCTNEVLQECIRRRTQ
jgi:hypothetical protein